MANHMLSVHEVHSPAANPSLTHLNSKSESRYDRRSVSHSVLVSSSIWGPRLVFCYCQVVVVLSMWSALSDERTDLSFILVIISSTCCLYLQFYMLAFYIVSCQESSSLWIPTIYSFTCNSSIYVYAIYTIYTRPISV
jgi:hypothetical protein